MKAKILSGVAILLVIGITAGLYWWLSRPQVIKFSDDSKLILLGADYGRSHVEPGGKLSKELAGPGAGVRGTASFTTPDDKLVVWVRAKCDYTPPDTFHGIDKNPNFQFYTYDPANTACEQTYTRPNVSGQQRGDDVLAIQLNSFPRREGKLYLRAQEIIFSNSGFRMEMADDKFIIPNPVANKSFPKWTPDPLPARVQNDDLAVILTKLVSGVAMSYQRDTNNPNDAMNKGVQAVFHVESNGKTVTNWTPATVETFDATGNRTWIVYNPQVQWNGDEATLTYPYGLWPDEPAWKLRFDFLQQSDFADTGAKNLNAAIALHKDRVFEFTVKPQRAAQLQP